MDTTTLIHYASLFIEDAFLPLPDTHTLLFAPPSFLRFSTLSPSRSKGVPSLCFPESSEMYPNRDIHSQDSCTLFSHLPSLEPRSLKASPGYSHIVTSQTQSLSMPFPAASSVTHMPHRKTIIAVGWPSWSQRRCDLKKAEAAVP